MMEEVIRNAFFDELEKIAASGKIEMAKGLVQKAKDFYAKHPTGVKRTALYGSIVGGTLVGKQAIDDWSLGRQIRKQQERAMSQRG